MSPFLRCVCVFDPDGDVDDLYRQSALRVRTANGVFVRWLREALARDGMGDGK